MSGGPGPKRRAGDRQVPEGFYEIDGLNPNSLFHLSLRVDYPNAEDRAAATVPVKELGGDIFVHGGAASIGCVALGDDAIEEVFTLVARVPAGRRRILLAPVDLRVNPAPPTDDARVATLYRRLGAELASLRALAGQQRTRQTHSIKSMNIHTHYQPVVIA